MNVFFYTLPFVMYGHCISIHSRCSQKNVSTQMFCLNLDLFLPGTVFVMRRKIFTTEFLFSQRLSCDLHFRGLFISHPLTEYTLTHPISFQFHIEEEESPSFSGDITGNISFKNIKYWNFKFTHPTRKDQVMSNEILVSLNIIIIIVFVVIRM